MVDVSAQITDLTGFGTDLGNFLSNIAPGVGIFVLLLGIFGGVSAIIYGIVVVIKRKVRM